jgi:hypothetical protein
VTAAHETHSMAALLADQSRQLIAGADQTLRIAVLAYDDLLQDPRRSTDTGYRMLNRFAAAGAWRSRARVARKPPCT